MMMLYNIVVNACCISFGRKILNDSLKRPVSIVGNEMHYITSTIIDKKLLFFISVSTSVS